MNTKEKIFESSISFLIRNPNASIQKIIQEVSVSRRTFYKYFSSKQDLVLGAAEYVLDNIISELKEIESCDDLIRKGIQKGHYYSYLIFHPNLYFNVKIYSKYKEQQKLFLKIIKNDEKYKFNFSDSWIINYFESLVLNSYILIHVEDKPKNKVLSENILSLEKLSD